MIGMAIFTAFSVVPPLLMRYLIDNVITAKAWNKLIIVAILIALMPIITSALRFINVRIIVLTSRKFIADMRIAMYRKILSLGMNYHGKNPSGAVVGKLMSDVNMLQRLIAGNTIQIIVDLIVFLFAITVTFTISVKLWFVLIITIAVYGLIYKFFSKKIRVTTKEYRSIYDIVSARLQETISGVKQVRIYNNEDFESSNFNDWIEQSNKKAFVNSVNSAGLSMGTYAISEFSSIVIMSLAGYFILKGEMSYGDLIAFDSFLWMAISPSMRLTTIVGQMQESFVSIKRILEVMDEKIEVTSPPNAPRINASKGNIEFKNITFSYLSDSPLYKDFSLSIKDGKTVALVGPTGCGKTTLTALLMRYWDVTSGEICINGTDIRSVNLKSLRNLFGVMLQTPVIFDGTLAENIAYGKPDASREEIINAAKTAEIYEMATNLSNGFDTLIGADGVKLSVGEKQRISIARAVLKNPLILIMDEATSVLDSESEALVHKALSRLLKNRTSIVVAHRLSTITEADEIIVLDNAKIIEKGHHKKLLKNKDGLYRKLYQELVNKNKI